LFASAGNAEGEGTALFGSAMALTAMGRAEESLAYYRRAAVRFAEMGDARRLLVAELGWMDALVELEQWEEVAEHAAVP
jgi:hypothetical protein